MRPLPSPYNFVPVTPHIFHPPWAALVSHDVPFSDGICGTFDIALTAATPIHIHQEKGNSDFYRAYPDGPYAIPGSTLKGLIRAVVEIAAFGKLGRIVSAERKTKQTPKGQKIEIENIKAKIRATLPAHTAAWPPDLAETIFGFTEGEDGLRSRVSFDTLVLESETQLEAERPLLLLTPVGRCAPLYLKPGKIDSKTGISAAGALPHFDDSTSHLRGWKRYALTKNHRDSANGRNATRIRPLPAGSRFVGSVRVHNLRSPELGAVLWALEWGGDPSLRHTLGMAKPYGYGSAAIVVDRNKVQLRRVDGAAADLAACRNDFVATMKKFLTAVEGTDWVSSNTLRQLRALADPAHPKRMPIRFADAGELEAAKQGSQALLPYAPPPVGA